jgi:hypothetical protein
MSSDILSLGEVAAGFVGSAGIASGFIALGR